MQSGGVAFDLAATIRRKWQQTHCADPLKAPLLATLTAAVNISDSVACLIVSLLGTDLSGALRALGSATHRWRSVVKTALVASEETVLTVRSAVQGRDCAVAFAGARRLRFNCRESDASLVGIGNALLGSSVTDLDVSCTTGVSLDARGLSALTGLRSLNLSGTALSDAGALAQRAPRVTTGCVYIYLSVCVSVSLSVCLSVCLSL